MEVALSKRLWETSVSALFQSDGNVKDLLGSLLFVHLIGCGELCDRAFHNYQSLDAIYLRHFIGCFGVLLMHVEDKESVSAVMNLLKGTQEELQGMAKEKDDQSASQEPFHSKPFNDYIDFIKSVALQDEYGIRIRHNTTLPIDDRRQGLFLAVTLAPCMRLYADIGAYLGGPHVDEKNAFKELWIDVYASTNFQENANAVDRLIDKLFEQCKPFFGETMLTELQGLYGTAMLYEFQIFEQFGVKKGEPLMGRDFQPTMFAADLLMKVKNLALKSENVITKPTYPQVLIIAGSDSGGCAGIQADMKSCEAFEVFSSTAITALTAQNTQGVQDVMLIPADKLDAQIQSCSDDFQSNLVVWKTGMLPTADSIEIICGRMQKHESSYKTPVRLILDPVMIASSGHRLIDDAAVVVMQKLIRKATVLTPNVPEAVALLNHREGDGAWTEDMICSHPREAASEFLIHHYPGLKSVVLKGGHDPNSFQGKSIIIDRLYVKWETDLEKVDELQGSLVNRPELTVSYFGETILEVSFAHPRTSGTNDHGTGCTLASAIAASYAKRLHDSVSGNDSSPYSLNFYGSHPTTATKRLLQTQAGKIDEDMILIDAFVNSVSFVSNAVAAASQYQIGQGHGPLLHCRGRK